MEPPVRSSFTRPLWDSHVHLFPDRLMQSIFKFFRDRYGWQLPFPAEADSLLRLLQQQGVERAFVLTYVHKPDLSRQVNRWLADLAMRHRWLIPFGAIHPLDRNLNLVLREALDELRFPGLKLHCLVQRYRPDDERLFPVYEALVERGRGLIIHASSFPIPAADRLGHRYIARLLRRYPRLQVIVPHLGLYDLKAYRALLSEHPGLYLDTAFVFQNRSFLPPLEELREFITDFPERIIYGSDFPFIMEPPDQGIERILQLNLPAPVYDRLFHLNAYHFLKNLNNR